jgi:hypothetical protein
MSNTDTNNMNIPIYISLFCLLIVLSVTLYYSYGGENISLATAENILILVFIVILVLMISISLLPSFKDVKTLFTQIPNVVYVIIYTIFCILFYRLIPSETLDKYSKIILLTTMGLGAGLFYKAFQTDYTSKLNINYERIKSMILFFCFITVQFLLYLSDPGGIISNRFGYSMLISLITAVFGFLYVIILISLSQDQNNAIKKENELIRSKYNNLRFNHIRNPKLRNKYRQQYNQLREDLLRSQTKKVTEDIYRSFSPIYIISAILFIAIVLLLYYLPSEIWKNPGLSAAIIIIVFFIFILASVMIIKKLYPEVSTGKTDFTKINKVNLFKRALLLLFGCTIAGLAIFWLIYNVGEIQTDLISVILNVIFMTILLYFVYRAIYVAPISKNENSNKNSSNVSLWELLKREYSNTNISSLYALGAGISIIIFYKLYKWIWDEITVQGGKPIIRDAISTNELKTFGNSIQLNGTDEPNYNYAISMWIFVDAVPPNANENYSKYTSLIDFGNKPNIMYNGETGKICILFDKTKEQITLYEDKFPLQKWVNIITNYNGGVFDIFIDGKLIKSVNEVVPYMTIDNFTIGSTNGIYGGVKNITYFPQSLTAGNIYYLYHTNKL